jgi:LysR family hydrogen peroxide-inducible transcriptional activator
MNIQWMTLRDLQYVVTVAEELHFGRAAKRCAVSQPALSTQIRKLEEQLGARFFERTQRQVTLTEQGRRLVDQARLVLEEAQKIPAMVKQRETPLAGPFRLGAIASVGPYLFPHLLGAIRKAHPELELFIQEGLTDGLIQQLRNGNLDAVIASPTFDRQGLREEKIYFEPFYLAAPKGHPLAKVKRLHSEDLHAEEMVLLEDGHCMKDQTLQLCGSGRRQRAKGFQAASLETLRQMVAVGMGYTILPQLAVPEKNTPLKELIDYRPFDEKRVGRWITLYSKERFSRPSDVDALAAFLRKESPIESDLSQK